MSTESDDHTVSRRRFLKVVGPVAIGAAGACTNFVRPGAVQEFEEITVTDDSVEYTATPGNPVENILFHLEGGAPRINVRGGDVRNIGFDGVIPRGYNSLVHVRNEEGQSSVIENIYAADGGAGPGHDQTGPNDPPSRGRLSFVNARHAGDVLFRHCNVQGMPDDGIYGSAPAHPDIGGNGTVRIEECYGRNSQSATYRIGSDGSYVKGCVEETTESTFTQLAAIWIYGGETLIEDCDIKVSSDVATLKVGSKWAVPPPEGSGPANLTIANSRSNRPNDLSISSGQTVNGSFASNPDTTIPVGVPTAAKQVAQGL